MSDGLLESQAFAIIDWLAELGARWGLPPDACRVHGLLYLVARPIAGDAISRELSLNPDAMENALAWLIEENLVTKTPEGWSTQTDPWLLMLQTLEKRRQRELLPAMNVLGPWRHPSNAADPVVARQAGRLLALVEDLAAIDAGAKRFSPRTLRRVIGIGGRAVRLFGAAGNKGARE